MAKGFKHGTSGKKPENPLNFAVVAYPSEVELNTATPEDTTITTIGVATTNPITGWHFSSEQPEDMKEGEVWFQTGKASEVEFNALKKNNVTVYPNTAKQMVSGTLKDVVAKTYQGGKWVEWFTFFYKEGDEYTGITGGWTSKPFRIDSAPNYTPTTKSLTKNADHILLSASFDSYESTIICHNTPIDLTDISTITLEFEASRTTLQNSARLQICDSALNGSYSANVTLFNSSNPSDVSGSMTLDVSGLSGKYIIGIPLWSVSAATITFKIKSIQYE